MDDYFAGSVARAPQPAAPWPPAPPVPGGASAYPGVAVPYQPTWGTPVATPWPYGQPPGRSGGSKLLLGLLIALACFVGVGVLTAIAIPVFLHQRELAANTVVAPPTQVQGMPRLTDAVSVQAEQRMLGIPGPGDHVSGVYGDGGVRVIAGVAKYHFTESAKRGYLIGAGLEAKDQGATLHDVDAGSLGGTMRCGESPRVAMTLCVFVDAGSYGIIVVTGPADDATATARAAREAFVRRR